MEIVLEFGLSIREFCAGMRHSNNDGLVAQKGEWFVTYYAVLREWGENWDAWLSMRQQAKWDEHAVFMNALADDGFVFLGGPLDDGEKILLIINASSEQEIVARLADDPWTPMGLLRIAKVECWEILLGENRVA
jgi:uncharacterized protein YciI